MQLGLGGILGAAAINYASGSTSADIVTNILTGSLLLVGCASLLYGSVMYVIVSRKPVARELLAADDTGLDFTTLVRTVRHRVTETRFVFGLSFFLMALFAASLPGIVGDRAVPGVMVWVIGAAVLFGIVGLYLMATYFMWKSPEQRVGDAFQSFAQRNGFSRNADTVRTELAESLQGTSHQRGGLIKLGPGVKVHDSISGDYRGYRFVIAAATAYYPVGLVVYALPTAMPVATYEALRGTLLASAQDLVDVIADDHRIVVVFEHGIAPDQDSMRFYFTVMDRILAAQAL